MNSQLLWNKLHDFVVQADEISDLLILAQLALAFLSFFIPDPAPSTIFLVLYLILIHYLTELLRVLPGFPLLKEICTFLAWGAKFQVVNVYFGRFRVKAKPQPEKFEWDLDRMASWSG